MTGALGQTLFPCPCRAPTTQSRGTQNQNHGACSPLRPAQPEPAVPPGALPVPYSSPVTPYSILRSSGEKSSSPLGVLWILHRCIWGVWKSASCCRNTYVCNGLRSDQNPISVSAATLICSFQEGNNQVNYKQTECFV